MAPPVKGNKDAGSRCHECNFPDQVIKGKIWARNRVHSKSTPKAEPKTPKTIADFFGDGPKPTVTDGKAFEPVTTSPEIDPTPEGFDRAPAPHGEFARLTGGERGFLPTGPVRTTPKDEVRLPTQKERAAENQRLIEQWCLLRVITVSPDKESPPNGTYYAWEPKPNAPQGVLDALREKRFVKLPGGREAYGDRTLYVTSDTARKAFRGVHGPRLVAATRPVPKNQVDEAVMAAASHDDYLDGLFSGADRQFARFFDKEIYRLTQEPLPTPKRVVVAREDTSRPPEPEVGSSASQLDIPVSPRTQVEVAVTRRAGDYQAARAGGAKHDEPETQLAKNESSFFGKVGGKTEQITYYFDTTPAEEASLEGFGYRETSLLVTTTKGYSLLQVWVKGSAAASAAVATIDDFLGKHLPPAKLGSVTYYTDTNNPVLKKLLEARGYERVSHDFGQGPQFVWMQPSDARSYGK